MEESRNAQLTGRPRPVGGKARARLELFAAARASELPDGAGDSTPAAGRQQARAREGGPTVAEVAGLYATAAESLASQPPVPPGAPAVPQWYPLGPSYIPNGQTYGTARVDVSGRVAAIAVDPSNSNHVLCGAAGGGVWESFDQGASWSPRTDDAATLTTGAIAFDPSDPSIVYVGTGEGNFYGGLGAGVLCSTDGGTTFARIASAPFLGIGFYDLIVDPTDGQRLYAATTNGVYVSTDGGASWVNALATLCWDLSLAPVGRGLELLAACSDGLHRSTNHGQTFAAVALTGAPGSWNRLAVSHAMSQPSTVHVWGASGTTAYLYRRDAGAWSAQNVPANDTGQAWYDWFCTTAPDDADQLFLGAIHAYRGRLSSGTWTWENISSRQVGDSIHPDQHAIAFDPSNPDTVFVGDDGGLFRSPDRGTTWVAVNQGLGITEVEYLAQRFGSPAWLIAGTQDNGSMRYTGSAVWEHVADGDGGDCGDNTNDPTFVYHSYYGMGMDRSTQSGDWGSFAWIGPNVPAGYSALFYPPLEVNGTTVAQAGQSVFVSRDGGTNWTEVALPGGTATAMDCPTPDRVHVGTDAGDQYRLDFSAGAWTVTTLTSPRAAWASDISVDRSNPSVIWATSSALGGGRAFRSNDGGTTWTDVSAWLPALPVNAVVIDPDNSNRVWVAADLGVYETLDAGATWSAFSSGLPNALIADLVFHPHARVLRAGTRNRGVWEIAVDGPLAAPITGVQWVGQLAPNQTARWFTFNWPACWHVLWTVMPTTVLPGAPEVTWTTAVERATDEFATYWITVTNLTGATVDFEGRYAILSRS